MLTVMHKEMFTYGARYAIEEYGVSFDPSPLLGDCAGCGPGYILLLVWNELNG